MGGHLPPGRPQVRAQAVEPRVVRVAVDVPALADQRREFDYAVPERFADRVTIGTMVRVPLHGRRVAGWVVADDVVRDPRLRVQPIAHVTGHGPSPDVVDLTSWGAWRWAGRRTALLRAASPVGAVTALRRVGGAAAAPPGVDDGGLARDALAAGSAIIRLAPATDVTPVLRALGEPALIVCPSIDQARHLGRGVGAVPLPEGWARAAAGGVTVIGARGAAWGPAPDARAVVVVDAHDRALVEERAPTWSAWVVAAERARRLGVPCVLISACPTLEQLAWGQLIVPSRDDERRGWSALEVIDRVGADPREGLISDRLVPALRRASASNRTVCILNRKGRIRLLVCRACGQVTRCEHCDGAMEQPDDPAELRCRRCHRVRPKVCQACGSSALRGARSGVTKVREDLEALAQQPVGELTADSQAIPDTAVIVGTEAVLHRLSGRVGVVVFLDFDAELLAARLRAAENALALLASAARLVGGRGGGRVIVQTRLQEHAVIRAATRADPGLVSASEAPVRMELNLPPASALAEISGDADVTETVARQLGRQLGIEVMGPTAGTWLVRAADHRLLCDALAAAGRPPGADGSKLRIDVDPIRA